MGLFRKKKADSELLKNDSFEWMTVGEAITKERMKNGDISFTEIMQRCEECCEQYSDAISRRDAIKHEQEGIDESLGDLETLDGLSETDGFAIEKMTKGLVNLIEERTKYQEREKDRISPSQYLNMERHADEIPASLEVLREQEKLRSDSLNDMHRLNREKDRLDDEYEQLKGKRKFYKTLSIAWIASMVIMFCIITFLAFKTEADMALPFMIALLVSAVYVVLISLAYSNNSRETKLTANKINRAIKLTNGTKIKYVNSTNAVDFACEKYDVNSYAELDTLWQNYLITKEEREKYRKNAGMIDDLSESLSRALTGYGIKCPEVLVCRPECILDRKERVEMRHRLNERRRAVRDRLDFANARCESTRSELLWMMEQFPERSNEFENLMRSYGLYEFAPTAGH